MSYYLPISLLKPGKIYLEWYKDIHLDSPEGDNSLLKVLILGNDEYLTVYLIEYYDITKEGKELLLTNIDNIINDLDYIPTEDYQGDDFYEKYGFHDEGIIVYEKCKDNRFTVWNDYVGQIKFKIKQ